MLSIFLVVSFSCQFEVKEKPVEKNIKNDIIIVESKKPDDSKQHDCFISTVKITPGMRLGHIAARAYGDDHFGEALALYNNTDPSNLKAGVNVEVPNLGCILNKFDPSGTSPIFDQMIQLEKVVKGYIQTEQALISFRQKNNYPEKMVPPDSIRTALFSYSQVIDSAMAGIKNAAEINHYKLPQKMLGQLNQVSENLKTLSEGNFDMDYFYDVNMVYQNTALAIKNGIMWAKSGYK